MGFSSATDIYTYARPLIPLVGVVQIEARNMVFEQRKWQPYVITCRYDLRACH